MDEVITKFEQKFRKPSLSAVRTGDSVRVHQTIREGGKKRIQVFEGMIIRTRRQNSLTAVITVRRVASGVGVEKTFFLHSPNVVKVEVIKRTKVRRNFLSYMRSRTGKSTRLSEQEFDREKVNVREAEKPVEEPVSAEEAAELAKEAEAEKAGKKEAKAEEATETENAAEDKKPNAKAKKDEAKLAEQKPEKAEAKKDDKAAEKKAKAEEFRKAQEAKNK